MEDDILKGNFEMFNAVIEKEKDISTKDRKVNTKVSKIVSFCARWESHTSQILYIAPLVDEGCIQRLRIKLI